MAEASPQRGLWIAFAAGALVAVAAMLVWLAWAGGSRMSQPVELSVPTPRLRDVPLPPLPDAPRLPDAPIPTPR